MEKTLRVEVVEPSGPTTSLHYFEIHEELDYLVMEVKMKEEGSLSYLFLYDPQKRLRVQFLAGTFKEVNTTVLHREALYTSCGSIPGLLLQGLWRVEILSIPLLTTRPHPIEILLQGGSGRVLPSPTTLPFIENSWIDEPPFPLFNRFPWQRERESTRRWYSGDFHYPYNPL